MKRFLTFALIFLYFIFLVSCKKNYKDNNNLIDFLDSKEFTLSSKEDKVFFLDSIGNELDIMSNDSTTRKLAFKISAVYYEMNNNKESFNYAKKVYNLSQLRNDSISIGRALYYMGDCYENTQKDSAYYYYKEAEKIFRLINNKEKLAKVYYNKAYLLFYEGNYVESEIETIKALQSLDNSTNYSLKYSCYSLQGSIHTELGELDKAIIYFNLAEEAFYKSIDYDSNTIYDFKIANVVRLSNVYDKKGEYQKSINALSKINTPELKSRTILYSHVISNLAYSKMKNGNLIEAKKLYEEALSSTNKFDRGYLYKILNYGEYCLITKDTVNAKKYLTEALELSRKIKSGKEVLKSLDFLSNVDIKNATLYKNEYIRVSDSIIKKQRASSNKFARIEYETDKLEDANKVLSKRNFYLFVGGALSIIAFLIILFVRHKKAQKREIEFLEQKNAADDELFELIKENQIQLVRVKENIQNKIAKELHDGVMNSIYSVRLNLGFLNSSDDNAMKEKRLVYITELQKIEKEVRSLSHDLNHETDFDQIDFSYLLNNLIESTSQITPTVYTCTFDSSINWSAYSSVIKINIYRILQELCSNVNKYAQAEYCDIKFVENENILSIKVKDDGVGFDKTQAVTGIGMENIKKRIKTIEGKITITSSKGNGCKVYMEIKRKQ